MRKRSVFMATEKGALSRNAALKSLVGRYSAGIIAINLDEGDKLIGVTFDRRQAQYPPWSPDLEAIYPLQ